MARGSMHARLGAECVRDKGFVRAGHMCGGRRGQTGVLHVPHGSRFSRAGRDLTISRAGLAA